MIDNFERYNIFVIDDEIKFYTKIDSKGKKYLNVDEDYQLHRDEAEYVIFDEEYGYGEFIPNIQVYLEDKKPMLPLEKKCQQEIIKNVKSLKKQMELIDIYETNDPLKSRDIYLTVES